MEYETLNTLVEEKREIAPVQRNVQQFLYKLCPPGWGAGAGVPSLYGDTLRDVTGYKAEWAGAQPETLAQQMIQLTTSSRVYVIFKIDTVTMLRWIRYCFFMDFLWHHWTSSSREIFSVCNPPRLRLGRKIAFFKIHDQHFSDSHNHQNPVNSRNCKIKRSLKRHEDWDIICSPEEVLEQNRILGKHSKNLNKA